MVNQKVLVRDKCRTAKKIIKVLLILFAVLLILLIVFVAGFLIKKPKIEIHLENPIASLVLRYTNEAGQIDEKAVIEQAIIEFNEDYINYILIALGVDRLHKSPLLENPLIEFVLDDEIWSSKIVKGIPNSRREPINNEDLRISISKEEAIKALLSSDIKQFMKDSVSGGRTEIEMVAGQVKLFSKGYLDMYNKLTGEEVVAE